MSKAPNTGKGSMRDVMPGTAALIDEFRAVFGAEYINKILQQGMRGQPVFWAAENGHTIGTPEVRGVRIGRDARGNCINLDDPDAAREPQRACTVVWPDPINTNDGQKE